MDIMYHRKTGERIEVYGFDVDHAVALYYDPKIAKGNGGNGWQKIQTKLLIPADYFNKGSFVSKTERNAIKSKLKLIDAIWECEDGTRYDHASLEDAIEHQRELMKEDK